jgi:DNA-binding XRE family transcriptional regulator
MSNNVNFTANQLKAIEWLATSRYDRMPSKQAQLADDIGVREETISRWKREPEFKAAVIARARELLGSDLPEIYAALSREAKQGSYQHIKLAMEMTGEYTPRQEVTGADGGSIKIQVEYADFNPYPTEAA